VPGLPRRSASGARAAPTLSRLFQIEAAARELVAAGPPDGGEPYVKDPQAPAGTRRVAWRRLASLLAL
jgi:hypothetical protein